MEGCGRPGEQGGMDQPNPEIRDDSYLNNVGGMNSEQPGEEANWAKQYRPSPCLNPAGPKSAALHSEQQGALAINNLILKPRKMGCLPFFLNMFYPLSVT